MSRIIIAIGGCAVAIAASFAIRSLQRQDEQIRGELSRLRELVESVAGGVVVTLTNVSGEFLGDADAPLTMVEFTDLQCPFCRQFHRTVFEQIKREYIDTGKLRYFTRDFPLESIHPLAIPASRAVHCAGEQNKFWEMRHAILVNSRSFESDGFLRLAWDLRLNEAGFKTCVADTERFDSRWQRDRADGIAIGISGTPSFVIGRSAPRVIEGFRLSGAKPYGEFEAKFKQLLVAQRIAG